MNALMRLHTMIFAPLERAGDWILPTLARFLFAAVLAVYFWVSGLTKVATGCLAFSNPRLGPMRRSFPG